MNRDRFGCTSAEFVFGVAKLPPFSSCVALKACGLRVVGWFVGNGFLTGGGSPEFGSSLSVGDKWKCGGDLVVDEEELDSEAV